MSARILVVDDDASVLRLVQLNLELEGFDVVTAADGRAALDAVAEHAPDLVVLDVMMPGLNGLEVAARLRKDDDTAELPIVILSAKAQELDVQHGRRAGADEYVTKPFEPEDLIDVIRKLLEG